MSAFTLLIYLQRFARYLLTHLLYLLPLSLLAGTFYELSRDHATFSVSAYSEISWRPFSRPVVSRMPDRSRDGEDEDATREPHQ